MTKFDELLKTEEVKWVKLADLIEYEQPTKYIVSSTDYNANYLIPVLTAGQTFILGYTDEVDGVYSASKENPVIIFDDFTTGNHWVDFEFKVKSSAMKILKPKNSETNLRYCYHYIQTIDFDITEHRRVWISRFSQIEIPIPSRETQQKIVDILDKFTETVTELQAELQARKKQYKYYKDKLLSFEEGIELKELREVLIDKTNIKWDIEKEDTNYHYIDLTSVDRNINAIVETREINKRNAPSRAQQIVKTADVLFGTTRPLLKRYCIVGEEYNNQICSTGFCVLRANTNLVIPKWLYYNISTSNFYNHVKNLERGASYPAISDSNVKKYKIPLPPLREQERIVSILDKFESLVNSILVGLPAEIDGRQKQYEYYRAQLLNFQAK